MPSSPPSDHENTKKIRSVCVFCGSGNGKNPKFQQTASELGTFLAHHNLHLVYGGGDMGLMGALAQATVKAKGTVTGIIPEFLLPYQTGAFHPSQQIVTQTMHERKAKMYDLADAFIALPGGIGTLEELVETMTWEQLDQHKKPIVLLNIDQFWQPFLDLLAHMKNYNFIRTGLEVNFHTIEDVKALTQILHLKNPN